MTHAYTEDQLVEQPAIGLFAALSWQEVSAMEENQRVGNMTIKNEAFLALGYPW